MSNSEDVLATAAGWRAAGETVALATVVETWGSSPRPAGSRLAVSASGKLAGSVSGGCIEGAVVLLITDGLDREGARGLAEATERLRHSCRRLIWLNPLLRYEGFQPRSQGIRAMLPHVDEFRPVHNLQSLRSLVETLSGPQPGDRTIRRMAA